MLYWGQSRGKDIYPVKGVVHSTQFPRVAGGGKGTHPVWDPCGRYDGSPEAAGVRLLRVGDVYSPARCTIGQGGAVCEKVRDCVGEKRVFRP